VNNNERQGAPITKQMGENFAKIRELVQSDHQLTCRMIADELDMSKETVRKILLTGSWHEKVSSKAHAIILTGTKGQTSHFVHGLCGRTSRR
jgi:orotate phosphoribosyltransferase-like protein